jgi:dipeptidyl aminopeptidase/acylaminoacyl peptidase
MNKKILIIAISLLSFLVFGLTIFWFVNKNTPIGFLSPLGSSGKQPKKEKPLLKYTFQNLKNRGGIPRQIKLEKVINQENDFTAYLFSYQSEGKRITGVAHIPNKVGKLPVIVMIRGYVDQDQYQSGVGTTPAAQVYSANGFITLAPDFLGYGESDLPPQSDNIWEERFMRPLEVMDLLASVGNLPQADPNKIFLWGHSNGGMIALSVLEISGASYPTTLWAPVSQFFPYDVLYYTFESDDKGKFLRKSLADFEKDYDVNDFSIDEYWSWIKAPVQVHQGLSDAYIPLSWSENLVSKLKEAGNEVTFYIYPDTDHQMRPVWDTVVQRDLAFFNKYL